MQNFIFAKKLFFSKLFFILPVGVGSMALDECQLLLMLYAMVAQLCKSCTCTSLNNFNYCIQLLSLITYLQIMSRIIYLAAYYLLIFLTIYQSFVLVISNLQKQLMTSLLFSVINLKVIL